MRSIFNHANFNSCLSSHDDTEIYIKDSEDNQLPCYIANSLDYDFKINNPNNKFIDFLKIDSCVYFSNDGRKCDFSINDNSVVCFIEIKSLTDFSNPWKSDSKKDDALDQIIQTIIRIKGSFPSLDLLHTFAIICLKPNIPNHTQVIQIADQNRINELLTECGCPNLYIGNEITFNNS